MDFIAEDPNVKTTERLNAQDVDLFHRGLAHGLRDVVLHLKQRLPVQHVVLSGGVWQNRLLFESLSDILDDPFLVNRAVPANDGGVSLGQAAEALRRL